MYKIAKQFDFCYGHRVWSQELNSEFSLDSCTKCRFQHGHQGIINISLESDMLVNGMVTDFKHLNFFKKWLDDTIDHKFIMDINDPLLRHEIPILFDDRATPDFFLLNKNEEQKFYTIKPHIYQNLEQCLREKYEGMVFVNFVPTSENLSKWIFDIVQLKMNGLGIKVSQVQFYETPKSQSNYFNQ